jgi:hypothetical protein
MGTAEPPEHWAPPESLDPTPVWRQYALVAVLLLGFLGLVAVYVVAAVAQDVVTPPAVVPGDRVVLSVSDHPAGTTKLVELPGLAEPFYLSHVAGEASAIRSTWSQDPRGLRDCRVVLVLETDRTDERSVYGDSCTRSTFDSRGVVVSGDASRGLDRYLVSRKGDRFVVNLDRPIQGTAR